MNSSNDGDKLVSVIIPVYNGARYLRAALDSAWEQSYQPKEIVAVDDGSTDESSEILASYGAKLRVVRQANAGVGAARNTGIAAARGDFIAFLDQDDWWLPRKLAMQMDLFQADPELGLVHTLISQYSESLSKNIDNVYDTGHSHLLRGLCFDRLLLGNQIYNSSVVIRKSVLERAGPFDLNIPGNTVQDYDLWLRIARHYRLEFVPEALTVLRLHASQGTWNRRAMLHEELGVLERTVGSDGLKNSKAMRQRMAELFDNLAVAHLDAGEYYLARRWFVRALRSRGSWRAWTRFGASLLPRSVIARIRNYRSRLREANSNGFPSNSSA